MEEKIQNPRTPEVDVDPMFYDRWSPRSFTSEAITHQQVLTLFEAARWAPSCNNEQPWLFIYALRQEDRERFISALVEQNRLWAGKASVLAFALARKQFSNTGKTNRHAQFDTGAAWVSVAFQARKMGLYAHAMAGFSREKAYEILAVPQDTYDILAAIAIGRRGDPETLPENLKRIESPNTRKPLSEVALESTFINK